MKLVIILAIIGTLAAAAVPTKKAPSPEVVCLNTFYGCITSSTTSWTDKVACFFDLGSCLYNLCPSKPCLDEAKDCYMKAATYKDFAACTNKLKSCFKNECKLIF
ncbi:uncharacterized protein LOC100206595 isoform X1 [Hydra vulgaris]|uniref:uncharacterized protein LOC100206595 isoform X1 n=1 Tax=Hydra vulgaris TaxID=6087 RepID=UPI00019263C9|nr:uncharacterized protein LOC100206595 [Hydra vulgaris]